MSQPQWIVIKFGGTSVSSLERWKNITAIISQHLDDGQRILVVCSACSQVSNLLEQLIDKALTEDYQDTLKTIESRYQTLALELQLDLNSPAQPYFSELAQLAQGIALLKEVSHRVRAQVMAYGELILTRLGVAYLQAQGLEVNLQDARDLLTTIEEPFGAMETSYLAARCDANADENLIKKLNALSFPVTVTQGFIAHNISNETVLLGRGGSDTSAAYFAAKIKAQCCEIWTDVPGVYTANPHLIPQARMLACLDYDEAQELASMGGKILHPNCIAPLKINTIPLYIKYTPQPERLGTKVCLGGEEMGLPIKSILTKRDLLLISIETVRMWHQVGFLAGVFARFKKYDFSIDLISTSESSITVSLDTSVNSKESDKLDLLLADLNTMSKASLIGSCASVSLVGRNIRAVMHQLTPVLEVFASQKIYLLSLADNDLNLTLVVDEDQAERIAKKLHVLLIENHPQSYFHQSWQAEFGQFIPQPEPWWQKKQQQLLEIGYHDGPMYVYDEQSLKVAIAQSSQLKSIDQLFYAMKANPHEQILRLFYDSGLGFECVSLNEVLRTLELFPKIERKKILFTPNFAPRDEYEQALQLGINVTIDNIYPLAHWPELFRHQDIFVRIDPGHGAGHHKFVRTGGSESKFGIALDNLDELRDLSQQHQTRIVGLHAHSGSGILQPGVWQETALLLTRLMNDFPDVRIIDLGGGLGIVEKPGQEPLDLALVDQNIMQVKQTHPQVQIWMEPGRFLVAEAGVILAKVTQTKDKAGIKFVGIETGMNSLIRPGLYGAYHDIVNLSKLDAPKTIVANIVGPICESGDTLGYSRFLPDTEEGDVLLIANTGAYGHCMSSYYNLREPAREFYMM